MCLFCSLLIPVYMRHEVSQLFRKEPRDFCILQSERIEGVKYLISLQSVDWDSCPESENVPMAKVNFLPQKISQDSLEIRSGDAPSRGLFTQSLTTDSLCCRFFQVDGSLNLLWRTRSCSQWWHTYLRCVRALQLRTRMQISSRCEIRICITAISCLKEQINLQKKGLWTGWKCFTQRRKHFLFNACFYVKFREVSRSAF